MIRRLLIAVALVGGGTAVVTTGTALTVGAGLPSAVASGAPRCTATSGVVVAVDFGAWGGSTVRACASTPTTGLQALHQGGFSTTGTLHDGPGFVCRIASATFRGGSAVPSTADQACVQTPPKSAYWSYWHADRGQSSWHYSSLGATSYSPAPGSVDAWTFGAGKPPQVAPGALRATGAPTVPPPRSSTASAPATRAASSTRPPMPTASVATLRVQPKPGRRSGVPPRRAVRTGQADPSRDASSTIEVRADRGQSSAPSTPPTSTSSTSSGPQTSPTSPERTASPPAGTETATTSQTTAGPARPAMTTSTAPQHESGSASASTTAALGLSATPTASASTPTVIDATPTAAARHSGGSPWPTVLGGALVLLLAAGAALAFRRRRQLG